MFNTLHWELHKNKRRPGGWVHWILAEIQPSAQSTRTRHPTNKCGSSMNIGCWTCLSMFTGQTEVGREATHCEADSLVQDAKDILAEASGRFPMGGASHFPVDADATPQPPPTNQRRLLPSQVRKSSTQREARPLLGACPHFLAVTASLVASFKPPQRTSGPGDSQSSRPQRTPTASGP